MLLDNVLRIASQDISLCANVTEHISTNLADETHKTPRLSIIDHQALL